MCSSTINVLKVWFICCVLLKSSTAYLPCSFYDSVNITDGYLQPNGSIEFNGFLYPPDYYALVKTVLVDGKQTTVQLHIRGCPCEIKPRTRISCLYGQLAETHDGEEHITVSCHDHDQAKNFTIALMNENSEENSIIPHSHFGLTEGICQKYLILDDFHMNHTGHVVVDDVEVYHHRNYCLQVTKKDDGFSYNVLTCADAPSELEFRYRVLPYVMLISVVFIMVTFIVYMCIPELRTLTVKCFLCYISSLAVSFTFLSWIQLNGYYYVPPGICITVASITYFALLSVASWSNIISLDIYLNFRQTLRIRKYSENTQFYIYMLYAWSLPLLLLIICHIVDLIKTVPYEWQPSIGNESCFLKQHTTSKRLYYQLPLLIMYTINIVLFVSTAFKIFQAKREIRSAISKDESKKHQKNLSKTRDNFFLYLRLFIMMGATWIIEAFSEDQNDVFFLLADILNTLMGIIIFVLFILRRRARMLIRKRWNALFGTVTDFGDSVVDPSRSTQSTGPSRAQNIHLSRLRSQPLDDSVFTSVTSINSNSNNV